MIKHAVQVLASDGGSITIGEASTADEAREFHLGDILSITTGLLVSPRRMEGVYDILNFLTGDNLFTHQLPRACSACKPFLFNRFPCFDSPEMDLEVATLRLMMETSTGKANKKHLVTGWLSNQVAKYGETFEVKPVPSEAYKRIHPIAELATLISD